MKLGFTVASQYSPRPTTIPWYFGYATNKPNTPSSKHTGATQALLTPTHSSSSYFSALAAPLAQPQCLADASHSGTCVRKSSYTRVICSSPLLSCCLPPFHPHLFCLSRRDPPQSLPPPTSFSSPLGDAFSDTTPWYLLLSHAAAPHPRCLLHPFTQSPSLSRLPIPI